MNSPFTACGPHLGTVECMSPASSRDMDMLFDMWLQRRKVHKELKVPKVGHSLGLTPGEEQTQSVLFAQGNFQCLHLCSGSEWLPKIFGLWDTFTLGPNNLLVTNRKLWFLHCERVQAPG